MTPQDFTRETTKADEAGAFDKNSGSWGELRHGPCLKTAIAPTFHKERPARWRSPDGAEGVSNKMEVSEAKCTAEEERGHNVLG